MIGSVLPSSIRRSRRELSRLSGKHCGMPIDDAEVVQASLTDPARFGELFDRHHLVVWTYLARVAGRDLADELAADVFVVAFERRASFDPTRAAFRSWLYGIATNVLRTRLRSERRGRLAFARAARQVDVSDDPITLFDDAEELSTTSRAVIGAIGALTRADRELILLFVWEGLSYAELAEVLEVPIGTVRSRLSRVRGRLRELLPSSGQYVDTSEREARP